VIAAPLQARGRTLGVLEVVNKVEGQFDGGDRFLIETLAASAAVAIDNADLVHRLEMRNRDLQAFAYTVAHDIKNSLGLVVGYADTLRRSIADLSSEELKRYLGIIRKHGRKAGEIVDELLLLAELGETEMERELLDMGSILEDVQDRLEAEIDERDALIGVPEAWPEALGHGPWVEEVWCNYIANALKYGGDRPRIQVGGEPEGRMVRFWVRDEGPGLTAEQQEGLFAPFARRSTRCKGYGLGLSIVRRIVEKLGGEVGADCAPGQGCGFWFTLPAAEAHGGS
jgi:signal transduction histidine kinase